MSFKQTSNVLVLEFDSIKMAQQFKDWLCGSGEQGYWQWQECQDDAETVGSFEYHKVTNKIFGSARE